MRSEIVRSIGRRPVPITPLRPAIQQTSGEWLSRQAGEGLDFRTYRSYNLGDDPRSVHLATTIRTGEQTVIERVALRDLCLLVVLDCSPSMAVRRKADMLLAAALIMIYSGVRMEMRVGAVIAEEDGYLSLGMGSGQRFASRLLARVEDVCRSAGAGNESLPALRRVPLKRLLPPGGILMYMSDFLDEGGEVRAFPAFAGAVRRYDFIPVVIQDEFECSFPELHDDTLMEFVDPETGVLQDVWLSPEERARLRSLHEERFRRLEHMFHAHGARPIHIGEPGIGHVYTAMNRYFLAR